MTKLLYFIIMIFLIIFGLKLAFKDENRTAKIGVMIFNVACWGIILGILSFVFFQN